MSKNATQTIAHGLLLANDTAFTPADAISLFEEVYQRYWFEFLKDRVTLAATFVTFAADEYVKTSLVKAREVLNLELNVGDATASTVVGALRKDDFHGVCADSERAAAYTTVVRWGAQKVAGSGFHRIAIFPPAPAAGITFHAEILPEYTTPTTTTALEGDDVDAFNVARLLACEVMFRNGDDPADIQGVFAPLDSTIKEKFGYIMERGSPNEHPQKEQ